MTDTATPEPHSDVLGSPYTVEVIEMPEDDEGAVIASLVRRAPDEPNGSAVLHVHGFADYFFQTEYAEWWTTRGYTFYAVDLRKHGRSLLPHQSPCFVDNLDDHFPELDRAWQRITERDGFRQVLVSGHSTGALTVLLWLQSRQPLELSGLVLNSPWFDMHGSFWTRTVGTTVVKRVGADIHIHDTNLTFTKGSFNVLLGTTRAGKTTLMQLMAGLDASQQEVDAAPERFGGLEVGVVEDRAHRVAQRRIDGRDQDVLLWVGSGHDEG